MSATARRAEGRQLRSSRVGRAIEDVAVAVVSVAPAVEVDEQPCKGSSSWDLDFGGLPEWYEAIQTCLGCPLLQACQASLDASYPGWEKRQRGGGPMNPSGVIWAGYAFSDAGAVLTAAGMRRVAGSRGVRHQSREQRLAAAS